MTAIPCVMMRGGTSRGPYFRREDLPQDATLRDRMLASVMGSGHELQVDGIGGGHPMTSKIAIVGRSTRADADVDYLFAQAGVLEQAIDTSPNCGNMLAGVGPFAIEAGLVAATAPETRVRIHNVNTGKLIEAIVQTPGGAVVYEGDAAIDGVPGTAAPILLSFLDAAGSKTGRLLPTGAVRDRIQGVDATCIDMAMPLVILRAADLGLTGHERPAEIDADRAFFERLEPIRREAGVLMGLGDVAERVIPKPVLVSAPTAGGTLAVRYFTPGTCHRAVAATGAVGIATACVMPGSLAHEIAAPQGPGPTARVVVEHPAGRIPVELELAAPGAAVPVLRASLVRTARRLFAGSVFVPDSLSIYHQGDS
jgi:2-methylaconitate cis-trans-isomerase PrpF